MEQKFSDHAPIPVRSGLSWLGVLLLLTVAVIHFLEAQSHLADAYKNVLLMVIGVGALVAAVGVWRNQQSWGWNLGAFTVVSTVLGYVLSRTLGLPNLPAEPDAWFEPLGIASLLIELGFVGVYAAHVLQAFPARDSMKSS